MRVWRKRMGIFYIDLDWPTFSPRERHEHTCNDSRISRAVRSPPPLRRRVTGCSSAKGTCTNNTGTGVTTLGTQVTAGACMDLCQEVLMRTDCTWVETPGAARIVGRSNSESEPLTRSS